jgi:transmembrane sensor
MERMTQFDQQFIEDPLFIRWIFHPTPSVDKYWREYILEHPEEKDQIFELKQRLSELKFSNDELGYQEKNELSKRIEKRTNIGLNPQRRRLIITSLLKYAAVAIVFAAIGGLLVYLKLDKGLTDQQFAEKKVEIPTSINGPLLITSAGESINLRNSNSSVDYSLNGTIVLNNDSVMHAKADIADEMNRLVIPYGNQSKVILSDSTIVWLNAGSELVYPTIFNDKTREVRLCGEAFFEVSKNLKKPFIVKTSDLQVKVLGTQFNISAYSEDKFIQTVLREGSVSIRSNITRFNEKELVLKPNQMASFNKSSNDTKVYEVDVEYYTLWTKGLFGFEEIDFNRVVKRVERFYNISVSFSEPDLNVIRISGKLDLKQDKDEVMEYLEKVSCTKINKISDNQYVVGK